MCIRDYTDVTKVIGKIIRSEFANMLMIFRLLFLAYINYVYIFEFQIKRATIFIMILIFIIVCMIVCLSHCFHMNNLKAR